MEEEKKAKIRRHVGQGLAVARDEAGLTQRKVQEISGFPSNRLSQIELGKASMPHLKKDCKQAQKNSFGRHLLYQLGKVDFRYKSQISFLSSPLYLCILQSLSMLPNLLSKSFLILLSL